MNRPLVALVDAYGTGMHLQAAFSALGADVVHVWSTPQPLPALRAPELSPYRASLVCTDPVATARELAAMNPAAVVAGQEPGVPLADILSELLDLPTNGSAQSAARRNKYVMIEALRKAGLRCADQFKSDKVEPVVGWAQRRDSYPVVVKPLSGSGSQGVSICSDATQVRRAAQAILGTTTMYGHDNIEVLAQSYLDGTEYIVDTVSCRGRHYTTVVWRYVKRRQNGRNIYHLNVLEPPDDPVIAEMTGYVHEVLDVIGIEFGPAHAEVMMTADGPALVEIGARLNGVMIPEVDGPCVGTDQATASALAYLRPDEFLAKLAGRTYQRDREALVFFVETDLDGILARIDDDVMAEINRLDSVRAVNIKTRPGERLRPTVDLPSSPMLVHLSNVSKTDLMNDYRRLGDLSKRLYHLV